MTGDSSDFVQQSARFLLQFGSMELALDFREAFEVAQVLIKDVPEFATLSSRDLHRLEP